MRALIVTSMWPSPAAPARGSFVRDQVAALRRHDDVEVAVLAFPPRRYAGAARELRRRLGGERFDVVHAHFGLTAWPALAARADRRVVTLHGTDLRHPRSRQITRAVLSRYDLVAAVSPELARDVPDAHRHRIAVLPCGADPTGSARRRATRPASGWAWIPAGATCCCRPIRRGRPSGPIARASLPPERSS